MFVVPAAAGAQTNGVTLIGSLNPRPSSGTYSSCWGWVSPDGHEYALLGAYTGTSIIDLDRTPIAEVAFISGPSSEWRELKTYKQYAYVVSEGGSGVQIIDLSGLPNTATLVRNFTYTGTGGNITRNHTITIADGYMYLNGSANWNPGGVLIFSLKNDPTLPQYVGQYQPIYIHDCYVRNDTLYGAAIYNNSGSGLYVVDVRNKTAPVLLRRISYTSAGTHNSWASVSGRYVYTTDEITAPQKSLKVWDLQNLGSGPPYTPLTQYQAAPVDIVHNVHGRGNYLYVSHYTAGMRVLDAHNPAAPVEAGYYDTYPGTSGGYNGCWGVYPYFPSGRWIGSDMQTGLYICRFSGLAARSRPSLLEPTNGSATSSRTFRWTAAANQIDDPHTYDLRLITSTLDTTISVKDTVVSLPKVPPLPEGDYTWYVVVRDEYTQVASRDTFHFHRVMTDVAPDPVLPASYLLDQNYPNPFNPSTEIHFQLPVSGLVTLRVYNVLGQEVATLVDGMRSSGVGRATWNASGNPAGVYFYRLTTPTFTQTRRMIFAP
jgi:choice-of-anchor B domain-containing protein